MTHTQLNIVSAFDRAESAGGNAVFCLTPNGRTTYATICDRIRRLAGLFSELGLKPGHRVAFSTDDDLLAATIFLALLRCGITAVFIDPETRTHRANTLLTHIEPHAVLLDDSLATTWGIQLPCPMVTINKAQPASLIHRLLGRKQVDQSFEHRLAATPPAELPATVDPESLAYILFTSGTTGQPKGVCITHSALFAHLDTLGRVYGLTASSRLLNPLILSHTDGMTQGPILAFAHQSMWIRPFRFQVQHLEDLLDTAYRERITHLFLVPTILAMYNRFTEPDNDSLGHEEFRWVVSCGATLPADTWQTFEKRFGVSVINMYGLSESVTGALFAGTISGESHYGTVGRPVDCRIKIVNDAGVEVPAGDHGELLMQGPLIMQGYFRSPEATEAVLQDGWLRTGDLARVNDKGLVEIIGRKKTVIICGGINIHPEEVDEVVQSFPGVAESATFSRADPMWGEKVVCAVVPVHSHQIELQALISHCRQHPEE